MKCVEKLLTTVEESWTKKMCILGNATGSGRDQILLTLSQLPVFMHEVGWSVKINSKKKVSHTVWKHITVTVNPIWY